jgi:hypothetical protein
MEMEPTSPADAERVQICFRCTQASADAFTRLAQEHGNGLRGLFLHWLAEAGYAEIAQEDLVRPDGRHRRQRLPRAA